MADRYIDVPLVERGIHCTAKLLDDRAPVTCAAVWKAPAVNFLKPEAQS